MTHVALSGNVLPLRGSVCHSLSERTASRLLTVRVVVSVTVSNNKLRSNTETGHQALAYSITVASEGGRDGDYRGDGEDTSPQHFGW